MDPSLVDTLHCHYLFRALSPIETSQLLESSRRQTIPPGQLLWSRGDKIDHIVILLSGKLKISLLDAYGNEFAIKHIFPIDSLGDATIIENAGQMSDVNAVEECDVLFVPKKDILNILKSNHKAALSFCAELSRRINNLTRELELQVFSPSEVRIMYKLLQLKTSNSDTIRITHSLLAELVGLTRERLTMGLNALENRGYITKSRGRITIKDYKGMLRELQGEISSE